VLSTILLIVRESSGSSDDMKDTIDFARDLANHISGIEMNVKDESHNDRQCTEEEVIPNPDTLWSQWKRDYLKRHQMYVEHITLYIYPRIRILDSQVRTCQHKTNLKGRSLSRVCDAGCRIG